MNYNKYIEECLETTLQTYKKLNKLRYALFHCPTTPNLNSAVTVTWKLTHISWFCNRILDETAYSFASYRFNEEKPQNAIQEHGREEKNTFINEPLFKFPHMRHFQLLNRKKMSINLIWNEVEDTVITANCERLGLTNRHFISEKKQSLFRPAGWQMIIISNSVHLFVQWLY